MAATLGGLKSAHKDEFRKIVGSYMLRTRRVDAKLAFPERQVQTYSVNPTWDELQLQQVIADNISSFNGLQQTSLLVALMSSPQALAAQVEYMAANGTAASTLAFEVKSLTQRVPVPSKAKALLSIANDLRKKNCK